MTDQASTCVLAKGNPATGSEPRRVRAGSLAKPAARPCSPAAPRGGCVAHGAISFDVARDAGSEVALGLPGVVFGAALAPAPDRRGWVESSPACQRFERARLRYAEALVASRAEGLLTMAARTPLAGHRGSHSVLREPVIGVNGARPNTPVVAGDALLLDVAIRAEAAVCPRDFPVPFDPPWPVVGAPHPSGR